MIAELFPNGVWPYAIGGLFVGLGVALIFVLTGYIAGASSILDALWSYVSRLRWFREDAAERDWRVALLLGLISGAALYAVAVQGGAWVTEVQPWRLLVGGLLIGFGARLGLGCTSGHGVCGLGSLSPVSLSAVVTFVGVAILTAHLVEALGVRP